MSGKSAGIHHKEIGKDQRKLPTAVPSSIAVWGSGCQGYWLWESIMFDHKYIQAPRVCFSTANTHSAHMDTNDWNVSTPNGTHSQKHHKTKQKITCISTWCQLTTTKGFNDNTGSCSAVRPTLICFNSCTFSKSHVKAIVETCWNKLSNCGWNLTGRFIMS